MKMVQLNLYDETERKNSKHCYFVIYGFDQQRLIWYVCRLQDMVFKLDKHTITSCNVTLPKNLCSCAVM